VGEDDAFLRQGGMINLVREHGSIHFEINPEALDGSHIRFSAKILALGKAGYESPNNRSAKNGSASTAGTNVPVEGIRRVERSVVPDYPEIAARMKLTGIAQVSVLVKRDGTVKEVKILGGHPLLADAFGARRQAVEVPARSQGNSRGRKIHLRPVVSCKKL
jgi:hypothetical protein